MKDTTNIIQLGYLLATCQVVTHELHTLAGGLELSKLTKLEAVNEMHNIANRIEEARESVNQALQARVDELMNESYETKHRNHDSSCCS